MNDLKPTSKDQNRRNLQSFIKFLKNPEFRKCWLFVIYFHFEALKTLWSLLIEISKYLQQIIDGVINLYFTSENLITKKIGFGFEFGPLGKLCSNFPRAWEFHVESQLLQRVKDEINMMTIYLFSKVILFCVLNRMHKR